MSSQISIDRMLSSVLEGLADPAVLVEPNMRILASNRPFRERFSGGNDPQGLLCFEITHGRSSPCSRNEVGRCPLESRENERVLHKHVRCLGESYEEVFVHPVENAAGEISAHLLVSHPLNCTVQLVGRSRAFREMMNRVREAAANDAPVLIWGEAGTGKTCVARTLHELSERALKPFSVLGCSQGAEKDLAARLFGSEAARPVSSFEKGMIESTAGGSILLRDAGELPATVAQRLSATVRRGVFRRVGGRTDLPVKVRWVLSGDRQGDLAWLSSHTDVEKIGVPALRNRHGDVECLVEHMVTRFGEGHIRKVPPETLQLLVDYPFPGNVRQLEGMIERACMLADGDCLQPAHFPDLVGTRH